LRVGYSEEQQRRTRPAHLLRPAAHPNGFGGVAKNKNKEVSPSHHVVSHRAEFRFSIFHRFQIQRRIDAPHEVLRVGQGMVAALSQRNKLRL